MGFMRSWVKPDSLSLYSSFFLSIRLFAKRRQAEPERETLGAATIHLERSQKDQRVVSRDIFYSFLLIGFGSASL